MREREPEPLIGKTIAGRFRVTGMIGAGGMGSVYAAVQEPLGRTVAIKVLKPSFARDEVAVARFKKEAAIVSGLSHPNIVTLHDYGETDDGLLYIAMEYLRGSTLSLVLRSQGPMSWRRTLPIVQDIVRGLAAAHAVGVIHRDLKLDNVMLVDAEGASDFVKILDFGVAKTMPKDGEESFPLTATDSSPGTPGYMSPELARGITDDPRSDFYALGVVWFELLAGRRPFTARNAMDVFLHQMTQPTPSVRTLAPHLDLPAPIDNFVGRLLDKDPTRRPKDTAAVLDAIFALEEELPTAPRWSRSREQSKSEPRAPRDARSSADGEPETAPTGAAVLLPTRAGSVPPPTETSAGEVSTQDPFVGAFARIGTGAAADEDNTESMGDHPSIKDAVPASTSSDVSLTTVPNPITSPTAGAVSIDTELVPHRRRSRAPTVAIAAVLGVLAVLVVVAIVQPGNDTRDEPERDAMIESAPSGSGFHVEVAHGSPPHDAMRGARSTKASEPRASETPAQIPVARGPASLALPPSPPAPSSSPSTTADAHATTPTSATPVPAAPANDAPSSDVVIAQLRHRLADAAARMHDRMLLLEDVPRYRELSERAKDELDAGRLGDASSSVTAVEAAVDSVTVDDDFIAHKITRIEASLPKDWPRDPAEIASVKHVRTEVHELFGERDLAGANSALNRLWMMGQRAKSSSK